MTILDDARAGKPRALARLVSLVEDGGPHGRALLAELFQHTGHAAVIGITGPPGAGKSTLVNALALELTSRSHPRIAILAVDPSSPYGGGAILGDRIRMQALAAHPMIYMRSMASRGQQGGLARATSDVIQALDAVGFDYILIETVGAGQAEVAVAREAHTTIVVEVPGLGDDIQAIKAGLLEAADLLVVNKADRDGADATRRHLEAMLALGGTPREHWRVPVLMVAAVHGTGIAALADAIDAHRHHLVSGGYLASREQQRLERELETCLREIAYQRLEQRLPLEQRQAMLARILHREIDPLRAAGELVDMINDD